MADDLNSYEQIKKEIDSFNADPTRGFGVLRAVCRLWSAKQTEVAQELILRCLERREQFGANAFLLDALVRDAGLFPYLEPNSLTNQQRIAFEYHRAEGLENHVLHREQLRAYVTLLSGKSLALTAPASFGKSLLIDAIITGRQFHNVVIVVPTIALIDETRRRLNAYRNRYKIITYGSQQPAENNIYILTAERVVEIENFPSIDFFVLDEFYKLSSIRPDERTATLNHAFYKLLKNSKQFYLLGPQVRGVPNELRNICEHQDSSFRTVATSITVIETKEEDRIAKAIELCKSLKDPTIIFCSSPERTATVAKTLVEIGEFRDTDRLLPAVTWISEHYHPDWHFVAALRKGLGVHHGRIPRALAQYVVRKFETGEIPILVCTSTLIEGVNTAAKNMIILDDKIDRKTLDRFTFNNICGRSGRMFRHFVGHVYLLGKHPQEELPIVDIPVLTQNDKAPAELLIQLDDKDLSPNASTRLQEFREQKDLSYLVLKANKGISLAAQIKVAREIRDNLPTAYRHMNWTRIPTYDQLFYVVDLMWRNFNGRKIGKGSALSPNQLTFMILRLVDAPSVNRMIKEMIPWAGDDPDSATTRVLDFIRLWAMLHFPRLLKAINRIQYTIFVEMGFEPGDYDMFASKIENLFLKPAVLALDEYGLPLELARKIERILPDQDNIDTSFDYLRKLNIDNLNLNAFEKELIRDIQQYL